MYAIFSAANTVLFAVCAIRAGMTENAAAFVGIALMFAFVLGLALGRDRT